MSTFKRFEDIAAWQKARQLTKEIYRLTAQKDFSKDFALKHQIRRASVSIMSNIALDQAYMTPEIFLTLNLSVTEISKMVAGLMDYLKTSGLKGTRFKEQT